MPQLIRHKALTTSLIQAPILAECHYKNADFIIARFSYPLIIILCKCFFPPATGPAVTIVDDHNKTIQESAVKSGALIRITCFVVQADQENFKLIWTKGSMILNHDTQRGGVRYTLTIVY